MRTLYTWHSDAFDITCARVDRERAPYGQSVGDYLVKVSALDQLAGTDQYLWCFLDPAQHRVFEICKPVEWMLHVPDGAILGYVDNAKWESYLWTGGSLQGAYQKTPFQGIDQSALVRCPVDRGFVTRKRTYKVISPTNGLLLNEEAFQES